MPIFTSNGVTETGSGIEAGVLARPDYSTQAAVQSPGSARDIGLSFGNWFMRGTIDNGVSSFSGPWYFPCFLRTVSIQTPSVFIGQPGHFIIDGFGRTAIEVDGTYTPPTLNITAVFPVLLRTTFTLTPGTYRFILNLTDLGGGSSLDHLQAQMQLVSEDLLTTAVVPIPFPGNTMTTFTSTLVNVNTVTLLGGQRFYAQVKYFILNNDVPLATVDFQGDLFGTF